MFAENSNIEKEVKNIEVIEKKKEETVCIENNKTNDKMVFYKIFNIKNTSN